MGNKQNIKKTLLSVSTTFGSIFPGRAVCALLLEESPQESSIEILDLFLEKNFLNNTCFGLTLPLVVDFHVTPVFLKHLLYLNE